MSGTPQTLLQVQWVLFDEQRVSDLVRKLSAHICSIPGIYCVSNVFVKILGGSEKPFYESGLSEVRDSQKSPHGKIFPSRRTEIGPQLPETVKNLQRRAKTQYLKTRHLETPRKRQTALCT